MENNSYISKIFKIQSENTVKEYDRPENLRKGCPSPRPYNRIISKANVTTASPALNQKVNKSEIEGVKQLSSFEIGINKQGVLPIAVETGQAKGYDTSVISRNLNSPIPFMGPVTDAKTLNTKVNNQEVNSVTDTLSIDDILEKASPAQRTELGIKLFNHLPEKIVEGVVAEKLSTMHTKQLGLMFNRLTEEVN